MTEILLYDHEKDWHNLLPFTFTRPVSEIRSGILKISEKWSLYLKKNVSFFTQDYLSKKYPFKTTDSQLIINSSILPDTELVKVIRSIKQEEALFQNELFIAACTTNTAIKSLANDDFQSLKRSEYTGKIKKINFSWDIFSLNHEEIISDFNLLTNNRISATLNNSNRVIGTGGIFLEEGAKVECAILNTTDGPIYIGKDSEIMEGSILRGPLAICEHATVKMGAKIYTGTTIGPHCKVGGEINNAVFFGFSNKAHDGFLGNAVIGEWCNLGADTNNSNLKNNYEYVKAWNYPKKGFIDTGLIFCGLFMGDHSKCSINTMFNTGTTVGIGANIFGSGFPRTFIPSFSWGGASGFTSYRIDSMFKTAEFAMQRRNVPFTEEDKNILIEIFQSTEEHRKL